MAEPLRAAVQLAGALQKFNDLVDSARTAAEDGGESSGEAEWQQDEPQESVERPEYRVRVQVPASTSQVVSVHAESEGDSDESEEARGPSGSASLGLLLSCAWVHML